MHSHDRTTARRYGSGSDAVAQQKKKKEKKVMLKPKEEGDGEVVDDR